MNPTPVHRLFSSHALREPALPNERRTRPLARTGLLLAELDLALKGLAAGDATSGAALAKIADFLEGARQTRTLPQVEIALTAVRMAEHGGGKRLLDSGLRLRAAVAAEHPSLTRPRVLIICGDASHARSIAHCLSAPDRLLAIAQSAAEAEHLLARQDVALAVLDPDLPDLDGAALVRLFRRRPDLRPPSLIVLGSPTAPHGRAEADAWLPKPFAPSLLADIVEERLRHRVGETTPTGITSMDEQYNLVDVVLETLPGYDVREKLGEGGMGAVYLAHEHATGRDVALKVLLPYFAREAGAVNRFQRETNMLLRLDHPNIVRAYATGHHGGLYYYAMELIEGKSLRAVLDEEGAFSVERALETTRAVTLALIHANRLGIVHRDVKPGNLLIDLSGRAKLADLGLAKLVSTPANSADVPITDFLGTPTYMSPEHLAGDHVDIRSDIYSLGLTLYEMLTNVIAFATDVPSVALHRKLRERLPRTPLVDAGVQPEVVELVDRMCATRREDRHATPEALLVDLERVTAGQSPAPTPSEQPRVTIITDDAELREHVRVTLVSRNMELRSEGIQNFLGADDHVPHVALIDGTTGFEGVEESLEILRRRVRWYATSLIVLVPQDEAAIDRAWMAGADDVLPIPLRPAELAARVRHHILR